MLNFLKRAAHGKNRGKEDLSDRRNKIVAEYSNVGEGKPVNNKKTLLVGARRYDHVTCIDWHDLLDENILDFHIVVLYLPALNSNGVEELRGDVLFRIQQKLAHFLSSDGDIFVLGGEAASDNQPFIWCPMPLMQQKRRGDTIDLKDKKFPELLGKLKSWEGVYLTHPHGNSHLLNLALSGGRAALHALQFGCEAHATNRAGEIIAGKWLCFSRSQNGNEHIWPGSITTLPYFANQEERQIIAAALTDILGMPQREGAPEWLDRISMESVKPIDERILRLEEEIARLKAEVNKESEVKAGIEHYKRLLYISSFELEDLVAECLSRLGAEIRPARYSQEEFVMHWNNGVYLAECKGVTKSISMAHLRQVQDYVLKYEEDEGVDGKGILFGNAWRELHPDQRDTNDRPIFPNNVVARAKQFGISLVSTVDLFHAFDRFLTNDVTADQVLKWVVSANGVADLDDL
ncbi:hypothetical protein ACP26O_18095 [Burkholderia sp. R-40]|uniref:hypothetical protein n=1 Tax=Burkholderia sp. R-40 TaxID=3416709 RepID=UPI003CF1E1FF